MGHGLKETEQRINRGMIQSHVIAEIYSTHVICSHGEASTNRNNHSYSHKDANKRGYNFLWNRFIFHLIYKPINPQQRQGEQDRNTYKTDNAA